MPKVPFVCTYKYVYVFVAIRVVFSYLALVLLNVVFWAGTISDSRSSSPPLFEPDPRVPEDDTEVMMGEVEDLASRDVNAFYLGLRFPAVGCRFADNSAERSKLMFGLHFALIMYMHGKARGSGKEMHHEQGQFLRLWKLLQDKYGPVLNSGQVQQSEDFV